MADKLTEIIGPDRLATRIGELAEDISTDYRNSPPLVVGVLKGSFVFLADLVRKLHFSPVVDFLRIASYGSSTESTGVVEIRKDLEVSVADRDVLIVEDIVDTGLTLDFLVRHLQASRAKSIRVCALLDKPSRRRTELKVDYLGFEVEDQFLVGYGLDCDEKYRCLPAVHTLEQYVDE